MATLSVCLNLSFSTRKPGFKVWSGWLLRSMRLPSCLTLITEFYVDGSIEGSLSTPGLNFSFLSMLLRGKKVSSTSDVCGTTMTKGESK